MHKKFLKNDTFKLNKKIIPQLEDLHIKAKEAKKNAYSPYSNYKVGAAILVKDGSTFIGCNVENASYGLTMCAERTAIFNAIANGYSKDDFIAIAISASSDNFSPCGACRQVISEFGNNIIVLFEFNEKIIIESSSNLLPYSFSLVE